MPLKTIAGDHGAAHKGRGATLNPEGRFAIDAREAFDDGWESPLEEAPGRPATFVAAERARSIISRNDSPDLPFRASINPYRGCEHGCIYCFARPSHAYVDLSPGLDFETRLFAKVNAADLLRAELARPNYVCEPISLGTNTDPYQPAERAWKITRSILEVAAECHQPVAIVTKNALIERDLDLLAPMAARGLAAAYVSVTTLDHDLARKMEPRASAPARRLQAIRRLSEAGVPVGVMVAPVVPFLTDSEMEQVLEAARAAGAERAGYILMRLPWEVKDLFRAWLAEYFPLKAAHVISRVQAMRGGRDNDPQFGSRMRGQGELADLLRSRFEIACRRLGYNSERSRLDNSQFRPPPSGPQMDLFG